jgi:hypothetical protein
MKISELNIYSNTNWCNLFGVFFIFFFVIFWCVTSKFFS